MSCGLCVHSNFVMFEKHPRILYGTQEGENMASGILDRGSNFNCFNCWRRYWRRSIIE